MVKVAEIGPVLTILNIHKDDINTVAWSALKPNLVATGSNDKSICILDLEILRKDNHDSVVDLDNLKPG